MLRDLTLVFLLFGAAFAYPNPDAKATSQHSALQATVTTPQGEVIGSILTSRLGKPIYSFRGIRYAKAPVNELRFQPPVPIEKWEGVYNATMDGPACPQAASPGTPTSEDCLLLNVYTTKLPKGNENPKRPVIVFFHGGAFYSQSASSTWMGPQYLLDQEVVLVVPQYRLGVLGFISTGDKEAPGNNGLKDQVLALKWVKENIHAFGGNPESVTIAGYNAGAASVTLHLVSPMSHGLFQRAIAMSGSIFGNWPIHTNLMSLVKRQAKLVGCPNDTSANIMKCLRAKSAEELGRSVDGLREFGKDPVILWTPVVEQNFGQQRFLSSHPVKLLQKGEFAKVPVMTGVTTEEYASSAFNVIGNRSLLEELDKNFEKVAPIAFLYDRDTEQSKKVSKELKKFYFEDKKIDNSSLSALVQLYADSVIGFGVNRAAKLLSEKNSQPVYYYRFNYKGRFSNFYLPDSNNTRPFGVVHQDDLIYLFCLKKNFPEFKNTDSEIPTVEKMTTMWGNFAKHGNPIAEITDKLDNVKWEPFTTKEQKYLDIGNKLVMSEKLYEKRYEVWEKLFPVDMYMKNEAKHG